MTAAAKRDMTETHTVYIDKLNLPFSVNLIEKDIARGEILMEELHIIHTASHSAEEVKEILVAHDAVFAELIKAAFQRAAESDQIREAERSAANDACHLLR